MKKLMILASVAFLPMAVNAAYGQPSYGPKPTDYRSQAYREQSFPTREDQNLMMRIRNRLESEGISPRQENIHIVVNRGMVTIHADINQEKQRRIMDIIRNLEGVRDIQLERPVTEMRQQQPYQRNPQYSQERYNPQERSGYAQERRGQPQSDQQIAQDIEQTLRNNWLRKNYEQIEFEVNRGSVTLFGEVETQDQIADIKNRIEQINGVQQVRSQLQIKEELQQRAQPQRMQQRYNKY